jgi:hypothetical protein
VLRFIAVQGEGEMVNRETLNREISNELDRSLIQLIRRELIEPIRDGYRFQVELIRRWFAQEIK